MSPELLAVWQSHLAMEAGAAATLLGLVFVAASINLRQIVITPTLPGRVVEALAQFVQVLFISMLMTIPSQPAKALSIEILLIAVCSWIAQTVTIARYRRARLGHPRWFLIVRITQTNLATIPFFIAGFCLWAGMEKELYWVAPGFLFSFLAGLVNSWVLLINVGRRRHMAMPKDDAPDGDE